MSNNFKELEVVEVWRGDNYVAIIRALTFKNTEIKIQVAGKKLLVTDPATGYYTCVHVGNKVEIPKLEAPVIEDDPPIEPEPEPPRELPTSAEHILTEDQIRMYQEWGLLPKK